MSANARLFLALWLPHALQGAVAQRIAGWQWPAGARLQAPERWHITLHFIGNVPLDRVGALSHSLAVPFEPFALQLAQPDLWRGGYAVLEALAVPPALVALHARLADSLHALGLPVESRPFRPHLTLARNAAGAVRPVETAPPLHWEVEDGYRLVRSMPGGNYQPVTLYRAAPTARTPG